ncbi:MAG: PilZ domain-containing protein [Gammaproteobacteria bacterium]|nr:PilZ domain-containing protein [Gammaproteobacteria bacterium]
MPRDYDEKRDFIRINVESDMSLRVDGKTEMETAKVTNLSGRGMMFITDSVLKLESIVEVKINPEKAITPPLHAMVRIVRVNKQRNSNSYEVGGVIQEIMDD